MSNPFKKDTVEAMIYRAWKTDPKNKHMSFTDYYKETVEGWFTIENCTVENDSRDLIEIDFVR